LPPSDEILDNLIIGTGAAGVAAGMALDRAGARFEMLDVGYDLDAKIRDDAEVLAALAPSAWQTSDIEKLFPPVQTVSDGVTQRPVLGSDHPYRIPSLLGIRLKNCATEFSHALGGFGNVWGGAMLPYSDHALRDWPVSLSTAYKNILRYLPYAGESDGLEPVFPLFQDRPSSLERSRQTGPLLTALNRRKKALGSKGVLFGRARVAVEAHGRNGCRRCGYCLQGCVYGSIFNPKHLLNDLGNRHRLHVGQYVMELREQADHVKVTTSDLGDESVRHWRARRVFVGAGQFGTTRLLVRSLGLYDVPIRISDSQYFFFPMLSYIAYAREIEFTLSEVFIEILNKSISDEFIHYQVYGRNQIFDRELRSMLPRPVPVEPVARRFYLMQGYLHSRDSGHLELTVSRRHNRDELTVTGVANADSQAIARRSQALLRRQLAGFGLIPPGYLRMVSPGRSFHTGGSFPMGGSDPVLSSDTLGRPSGLRRVHIVDAASFPTIPGSTILMSIMANADRIAEATLSAS
jgi:choline dehydrogenase-like flavoprotein